MNSNFISINHSVSRETASIRNIHTITSVAILAAISFALAFFEFPVPLSPSFAKMDISDSRAGWRYDTGAVGGRCSRACKKSAELVLHQHRRYRRTGELFNGQFTLLHRWPCLLQMARQGMAGVSARFGGYGCYGGAVQLFHFAAAV